MKTKLWVTSAIVLALTACNGGGTTKTKPTVQTPNTANAAMPWGAPVVQQAAPQPVVQQLPQYTAPVRNPEAYTNHAAVAQAGTTAVDDGYVRASTENFRCDNGMNITIKHLEADTITIAASNSKGNSILKRTTSASGELYAASSSVLGKKTQWHQKAAMAHLSFTQNNREVNSNCALVR